MDRQQTGRWADSQTVISINRDESRNLTDRQKDRKTKTAQTYRQVFRHNYGWTDVRNDEINRPKSRQIYG